MNEDEEGREGILDRRKNKGLKRIQGQSTKGNSKTKKEIG
jgi:hypothetical protein